MLFHVDVYFPEQLKAFLPKSPIKLVWSQHAVGAFWNDRYGRSWDTTPYSINPEDCRIIEVEFNGRTITKVLYRVRFDSKRDLCIAVIPQNGVVKTCWFNMKDDTHKTLDVAKYERA